MKRAWAALLIAFGSLASALAHGETWNLSAFAYWNTEYARDPKSPNLEVVVIVTNELGARVDNLKPRDFHVDYFTCKAGNQKDADVCFFVFAKPFHLAPASSILGGYKISVSQCCGEVGRFTERVQLTVFAPEMLQALTGEGEPPRIPKATISLRVENIDQSCYRANQEWCSAIKPPLNP